MAEVTKTASLDQEKSSPTTSGPDSEIEAEELPKEEQQAGSNAPIGEDLTNKVSAGANYLGSIFSNAWSKTAKTANDATATSSSFLSSAFNKVGNNVKGDVEKPEENGGASTVEVAGETGEESNLGGEKNKSSASAFLSSAWNKMGEFTRSANVKEGQEKLEEEEVVEATATDDLQQPQENLQDNDLENNGKQQANFFTNFSSMVGKVANNASTVIRDKVSTSIIGEFNKQQEEFIKNKGQDSENGLPPWIGYQDEEAMKGKILALSNDKRNFVRAPPAGVAFEFDYASVSATAMALLQEDPQLEKMRYELVPKRVNEDEFWRNYFYRVNLIRQSFDLKNLENNSNSANQALTEQESLHHEEEVVDHNPDHDDEFVSESYQASTDDINEANASMKRLGVSGNENEEWEAELEGELNEFEMVNSKDGRAEDDPEWENQIQQMLDAEESKN